MEKSVTLERNKSRTDTKKMVTLAVMAALAYMVMVVVKVPVVLFLKYEPKDVIITISGFMFVCLHGGNYLQKIPYNKRRVCGALHKHVVYDHCYAGVELPYYTDLHGYSPRRGCGYAVACVSAVQPYKRRTEQRADNAYL